MFSFFVSINLKRPVLVNYNWYRHYFCIFVMIWLFFNCVLSLNMIGPICLLVTSRSHAAFSTLLTSKIVFRTSQGYKKIMLTWLLGGGCRLCNSHMPDYILFHCMYIVFVTTILWWPKCTVTWHTVYHKLVESILVIGTRPNYFVCSICPTKALNYINCNKDVVWKSL